MKLQIFVSQKRTNKMPLLWTTIGIVASAMGGALVYFLINLAKEKNKD